MRLGGRMGKTVSQRLVLLGWACLLGMGCGGAVSEESAGGGVVIPNGIALADSFAIQVVDSSGTVRPGVRVRLMAGTGWSRRVALGQSPVLDSLLTGAGGSATFALREKRVFVIGETAAEVFMGSLQVGDTLPASGGLRMVLAEKQELVFQLDPSDPALVQAAAATGLPLFGTPWVAQGSLNGLFRALGLPGGNFVPVLFEGAAAAPRVGARVRSVAVGDYTLPTLQLGSADEIPLTGFEGLLDGPLLEPLRPGGDLRMLSPGCATVEIPFTQLATETYVRCANPAGVPTGFGIGLGSAGRAIELGAGTALRLRVRGEGDWVLRVTTQEEASPEVEWQLAIPLDSTWRELSLPFADMRAVEDAAVAWPISGSMPTTAISWQGTGAGWIEVDDLWFQGVSLEEWAGELARRWSAGLSSRIHSKERGRNGST